MTSENADRRPTLGEETRAVVRTRIVGGAATALAATGFDVTVDDIAAAAGVSRRTVFRHFASHDEVLKAAVGEILDHYDRLMPAAPAPGTDLEAWLRQTAVTMHDLNARLMGKAFWDIHVERSGLWPEERARLRHAQPTQIALYAWRLAQGRSRPPAWVVDAFCLQLSGFATNCLGDYGPEKAALVTARILTAVLTVAVAETGARSPG